MTGAGPEELIPATSLPLALYTGTPVQRTFASCSQLSMEKPRSRVACSSCRICAGSVIVCGVCAGTVSGMRESHSSGGRFARMAFPMPVVQSSARSPLTLRHSA